MNIHTPVVSVLILAGAGIMLYSIRQFQGNIRLLKDFYIRKNRKLSRRIFLHMAMMVFFFTGYLGFFYCFITDIHLGLEMITANVFFFGAIFVAMGNNLHRGMLFSIKNSYQRTLRISAALEEEREKLLTANRQLLQTEDVTILALAYQAELRDGETGSHISRTSEYVELIARRLKKKSSQSSYLTEGYVRELVKSAPLHDIGKVGIPDRILRKKGTFTPEEFEIMKKHCEYGSEVIRKAQAKLNFQSFLEIAAQLTLCHHEKWDGTGYPAGLAGEHIPLSARIMALADVYDALRSKRCYKDAFSHGKACAIIREERGRHFDPEIVDAFFAEERNFARISIEHGDEFQDASIQSLPALCLVEEKKG